MIMLASRECGHVQLGRTVNLWGEMIMSYNAKHGLTEVTPDRIVSALKLVAAVLATAIVLAAYLLVSAAVAMPGTSHSNDPRCALTTLTASQCAMGFADNSVNGDN